MRLWCVPATNGVSNLHGTGLLWDRLYASCHVSCLMPHASCLILRYALIHTYQSTQRTLRDMEVPTPNLRTQCTRPSSSRPPDVMVDRISLRWRRIEDWTDVVDFPELVSCRWRAMAECDVQDVCMSRTESGDEQVVPMMVFLHGD